MAFKDKEDDKYIYKYKALKEEVILSEKYQLTKKKTVNQKQLAASFFGMTRFVFNLALELNNLRYKSGLKRLTKTDMNNMVNNYYKTNESYAWLNDADKFILTNAIFDLYDGYKKFFDGLKEGKKVGFPKFKSRKNRKQSYTTNITNGNIKVSDKGVTLPKIGFLKFKNKKNRRYPKGEIKTATLSMDNLGNYFVSVLYEEKIPRDIIGDTSSIKLTKEYIDLLKETEQIIGLDLGIKTYYTASNGYALQNPRFYNNAFKKLRILHKRLSRCEEGSKRYEKMRILLANHYKYIKNMRTDFLHKQSTKLVNDNQIIIIEDLNVKGLIKNKRLSKEIQSVAWGEFKRLLTYKCEKQGKILVKVDRFYPSSKVCNCCGYKNKFLTLSDRLWQCPKCRTTLDRDQNASINIEKEGIRILLAS